MRNLRAIRALALAVLMLLLAACGGGNGAEEPAASDDPSASEAQTAEAEEDVPEVVRIGIGGSGSLTYAAAYVAQGLGYFDEELEPLGSKAEVIGLEGSVAGITAAAAGDVEFTASQTGAMLNAIGQGADLQQIASFVETDIVFVGTVPGNATDLSDPAALVEGKRWGIPGFGAGAHLTALNLLNSWDYGPNDVGFVTLGHVQSQLAAIEADLADYYWVGTAAIPLFEDGTLELVLDFYDKETTAMAYGGPYSASGIMGATEFVQSHPKTSAAVVRAIDRALQFIQENIDDPQAVADAMPDDIVNDNTATTLKWVLKGHAESARVDAEAVQRTIDAAQRGGTLPKTAEFDLDAIIDNSFLD